MDVDAFDHPEHLTHGEHGLRDPAPLADVGPVIYGEGRGDAEGASDDDTQAEATAAPLPAHIEAMDDDEWETFMEELGQVRAGVVRQAVQEVADNLAALDARGLETIGRARRVLDAGGQRYRERGRHQFRRQPGYNGHWLSSSGSWFS